MQIFQDYTGFAESMMEYVGDLLSRGYEAKEAVEEAYESVMEDSDLEEGSIVPEKLFKEYVRLALEDGSESVTIGELRALKRLMNIRATVTIRLK